MTTATESPSLLRTPFYQYHVDHGAKLVDFTGWEMPIMYGSILEEHHQVRRSGGLFDVSHMGRLRFNGKDAQKILDRICTRQIYGMQDGQARYSLVCNERGGCRDDVLVYKIDDGEYLMVCNAANREKLLRHIDDIRGDMTFKLKDETESTAMIALQGPKVMGLLSNFSSEIPSLKRYRFTQKSLLIAKVLVSRTGYTGEDGVEVILPATFARKGVEMMLDKVGDGDDAVIKPAGLGARDSLRLEAAMPLYGHELTEDIDPLSAGLKFAVKIDKGDENPEAGQFIGQDALKRIAAEGIRRPLVGLELEGRRAARQGMPILHNDAEVGVVTSGCLSPTLEKSIAMGYVEADHAYEGATLIIDLGRTTSEARVVKLPFYKAG